MRMVMGDPLCRLLLRRPQADPKATIHGAYGVHLGDRKPSTHSPSAPSIYFSYRTHLLNPGEKVLSCSAARIRHRGMFHARTRLKPRLLILTDQSRLLCVKTTDGPATAPNPTPKSSHSRRPSSAEGKKDQEDGRVARIKIEVLLSPPDPVTANAVTGSSLSPANRSSTTSRRGSSVGQQGQNTTTGNVSRGSKMRRLSVSTTASRISIRGRSAHRKSAEVLVGVEANKEKGEGTLVIQTVRFCLSSELAHTHITSHNH